MSRSTTSRSVAGAVCAGVAILLALLTTWIATRGDDGLRDGEPEQSSALAPLVSESQSPDSLRGSPGDVQRSAESSGIAGDAELPVPDPDLDLHGLVLDVEERGIAGALVAAIAHPWRRVSTLNYEGHREERRIAETRTASDGSFRLRLARGAVATLRVEAPGFARREIAECQAGERVVVVLPPGVALEVFARDEAGDGVAGANVRFWRRDDVGAYDTRGGETDDSGVCRFDALETGFGTVDCVHPVLGSAGWKQVEIGEKELTRFEVVLPAGRTLRGKVTDAETKLPIAGARVGENWVLGRAVTTLGDGSYELRGWTGNGVDDVHVIAEGYGRAGKLVPPEGPIDFALSRGDLARGRIVSAAGAPIAGALVSAVASKHDHTGQQTDTRSTLSAADGRFELTSLRRDLPHTLVVQATGHGRFLLDFDAAPKEPGVIDLGDVALPAARSISGVALQADDAPLARAKVGLAGHNADRKRLRIHTEELAQTSYGHNEERRTDDRGRFRFPDLSPGTYRLTLELTGAPEIALQVELAAERDQEGLEIRLPAGKSLTVRAVDGLDAPVPGANVNLYGQAGERMNARTGSDGTCVFRALPETKLNLRMYSFGEFLPPPSQEVVPADQEVRVVLRRLAYLKGSVVDASGTKLPHLEVEAVPPEGEAEKGASDDRGDFSIRVAHGEHYRLRLNGSSRVNWGGGWSTELSRWRGELENVIAPAEGLVMRAAEIEANGFLDVRVEDADGRPLENAEVWISGGGPSLSKKSDPEGKVRFENLLEGQLWVYADPPLDPARPWVRSESIVTASGAKEVVVRVQRSQRIEGTVLLPSGAPAGGVQVQVRGGDVLYAFAKTDEAGRFHCIVEPAEEYYVTAELSRPGEPLLRGQTEPFAPTAGPRVVRLQKP